jgi:transposase
MARSEKHRAFDQEFKLAAVQRLLSGESGTALCRELKVLRKSLYDWRKVFLAGGPGALRPRPRGRPPKLVPIGNQPWAPPAPPDELTAAKRRVAELERKIGQQQLELDFFRQALRQVRATRQPSDGPGARASIASSKR